MDLSEGCQHVLLSPPINVNFDVSHWRDFPGYDWSKITTFTIWGNFYGAGDNWNTPQDCAHLLLRLPPPLESNNHSLPQGTQIPPISQQQGLFSSSVSSHHSPRPHFQFLLVNRSSRLTPQQTAPDHSACCSTPLETYYIQDMIGIIGSIHQTQNRRTMTLVIHIGTPA
jgi:hypothetical protein